MLSSEVQKELRRELDRLTALRDETVRKIDAKIASIRNLLTDDGDFLPFQRSDVQANGTFAGKIRAALAGIGRAARAAEVAERLQDQGVRQRGKNSLKMDVSVELHRMAGRNTGGVRKVRRGLYVIDVNSPRQENAERT